MDSWSRSDGVSGFLPVRVGHGGFLPVRVESGRTEGVDSCLLGPESERTGFLPVRVRHGASKEWILACWVGPGRSGFLPVRVGHGA